MPTSTTMAMQIYAPPIMIKAVKLDKSEIGNGALTL